MPRKQPETRMSRYVLNATGWTFAPPADEVYTSLPADAYLCTVTISGVHLVPERAWMADERINTPNRSTQAAQRVAAQFVAGELSAGLRAAGVLEKLAFLFHGPPGCGKSMAARAIAEDVVARGGIVIARTANIGALTVALRHIREVEPDRYVLVVLEEFDAWMVHSEEELLQLLDGQVQVERVLYIFNTNHVEQLPARIVMRYRRITHQFAFGLPRREERFAYFAAKLPAEEHALAMRYAEATEGMTLDQCAQVLLGTRVLGMSFDAVLADYHARCKLVRDADVPAGAHVEHDPEDEDD